MMKRWMMGCAAMLVAGVASAQIYECIDTKGNKEFAQACPPGTVKETRIKSGGAPASGGSAAATKSLAEKDAEFRKRSIERQEAETKAANAQADAKQNRRNCDDARSQLKQLQDGLRVARIDPNTGERSFLEDKERPGEIVNAQKAADGWCNKK